MEIKITEEWVLHHRHPRAENGYKHRFGHVLVIGGSPGFYGSVLLTAEAALRSGCGLVSVLAEEKLEQALLIRLPEVMTIPRSAWHSMDFKPYQAIAIGPGLGQGKDALEILTHVLLQTQIPLIIDADALNLLAANPNLFDLLKDSAILTPHVGEFARMHGAGFDQHNPLGLAQVQVWKNKIRGVLVLKGAPTHVFNSVGIRFVNMTGNDGMATAGSGDVLTGIIAGIAAQGYSSDDAACLGVYLHGLAGDTYAQKKSKASLVASDLIEHLGNTKLLD